MFAMSNSGVGLLAALIGAAVIWVIVLTTSGRKRRGG